jgi:hypothetical protein
MAARKHRGVNALPDTWREKIQLTQIMNRLNACAQGDVEMTADQIAAAKLILSKTVPDLARTELTGPDGEKLSFEAFITELRGE